MFLQIIFYNLFGILLMNTLKKERGGLLWLKIRTT